MKDRMPWRIDGMAISAVLCLLFACFILLPQTVIAQPFDIMQITNTAAGDNRSPSINPDGSRIAFYATSDLVPGNNADSSNEIFLYNATTGTFTQITNTTGGSTGSPSINADGTRIAFVSDMNIVPPNNADLTYEIFLYNSTTGTITQITNTPIGGSGNFSPAISGDGTRIAFKSDRNIVPPSNADGNFEIFLYSTTGTITQITDTTTVGDIGSPSINADGTRIAFYSNMDLVAGSNADLNDEIFLYNTTAGTFTQITDTLGSGNYNPSIDANGTRIAFYSNRNIVPPNNADGNTEIFLYSTTGTFTQITNTSGGINNDVRISSNGTRIAFESNRDLVPGSNADLNTEIFFYDIATGIFTQITNTPVGGTVDAVSINANGTRVAFYADRDLTGDNTDRNREIYLASALLGDCYCYEVTYTNPENSAYTGTGPLELCFDFDNNEGYFNGLCGDSGGLALFFDPMNKQALAHMSALSYLKFHGNWLHVVNGIVYCYGETWTIRGHKMDTCPIP